MGGGCGWIVVFFFFFLNCTNLAIKLFWGGGQEKVFKTNPKNFTTFDGMAIEIPFLKTDKAGRLPNKMIF